MPRDRRDDEFDEYDRPLRRNDRDDDRPRGRDDEDRPRRRRRDTDDTPAKKDVSVLGIFGMIASILALLMSLIPFIGMFACIPGGIALIKSSIALLVSKLSKGRVGSGIPLTAVILSSVAILISILQIVAIVAFAATRPTTPAPSTDIPADVTITAVELDREYDRNVAAADSKFKGKMIDVTGVVFRVTDEVRALRMTVELEGADDKTVDCDFRSSEKTALSKLKEGDTVTIRGTCVGRKTVEGTKWVTLENCTVIPPGTKPAEKTTETTTKTFATDTKATDTKATGTKTTGTKPTDTKPTGPKPGTGANAIKAADLAKAFADDETAANSKYKGKVIEVSGQVYKSDTGPVEKWYIILGKDQKDVECRFKPDTAGVRELDLMDAVIIRGKCIGLDDDRVTLEDCTLVK